MADVHGICVIRHLDTAESMEDDLMTTKVVGKVFWTDDLDQFRKLETNRDVLQGRVDKVKKSIKNNGWIKGSAILVNEKMEIIDGQARLEACKQLELPIQYIVGEGIGRKECAAANNSTIWRQYDWIKSYADGGNTNYKYLQILMDKYAKKVGTATVMCAVSGTMGIDKTTIQNGRVNISAERFEMATRALDFVSDFEPYVGKLEGRKDTIMSAICFLYNADGIDNNKLLAKFKKNRPLLGAVAGAKSAFDELSNIYNYRSKEYVDFYSVYQNALKGNLPWYEKRYGGKRNDQLG